VLCALTEPRPSPSPWSMVRGGETISIWCRPDSTLGRGSSGFPHRVGRHRPDGGDPTRPRL